ncbi:MAG: ethylbenzene dehydrogenase-related protein [Motiliproteus sp.]
MSTNFIKPVTTQLCMAALLAGLSLPVLAVDWGAAKAAEVPMFFPGQTSLEWMYGKKNHDGAGRYKKRKKNCRGCHTGDEAEYGPKIVKGGDTEAGPLAGRNGFLNMQVKAANDGSNLYLRLEWPKQGAASSKQDADNDTKVTFMFDDGAVEEFTAGGCWAVCHIDSKKMPAAKGDGKTKYLGESRTNMTRKKGGADKFKSDGDLAALMSSGVYLEYWQAQLNPGQPAKVIDGYILKERSENSTATVTATATEAGGNWVVEFSRPLAAGANQKALSPGKQYTVGFALHDQNTEGRYHLTSLQYTMQLDGGDADLVAVKQ